MKKSIKQELVLCQTLSQLPLENFNCHLIDYGKKMTTTSLIKIIVAAQLDQWNSYYHMSQKLRANPVLREEIGIDKISGAQISRRINELPTERLQALFEKMAKQIYLLTADFEGISKNIGPLKIVDSTEMKLPKNLCDWAFISTGHNAVKMHTRLVVVSKDVAYPEKIVPSLGNVSDFESSSVMIEEDDATYVMDRGYPSKKNLTDWLDQEILFVVRITKSLRLYTLEQNKPTHPSVTRDEIVNFGISTVPIRYIEFTDEKNQTYRILTTRFDLTDQEILEIYKSRWLIELFFKWIKGHLKFTKIWSTKPQGIWNQMFLSVIAFCSTLITKLRVKSSKSQWKFFETLQTYWYKTVRELERELRWKPSRTSKGRQKVPIPSEKNSVLIGSIALKKQPKATKKR